MPALLTTPSTLPNSSIAVLMMFSAPSVLGHGVVVGHRTAAGVLDLLDHLVGHVVAGAGAVTGTAEIVDDDAGALFGERQRIFAAESASGPGDDDDAILHSWHEVPF